MTYVSWNNALSRQAGDYRQKRSGNMQYVADWQANGILGEIMLAMMRPIMMV